MKRDKRGFSSVCLYNPKYDGNVGGVIRSSACFNCNFVTIIGDPQNIKGRIERTDTRSSHRHLPVMWIPKFEDLRVHECKVVAVELTNTAHDLSHFIHPEAAMYLFGPENGSLPQEIIDICDYVVKLPTIGCLNLANCVTAVLWDRHVKSVK